jgi:hypothetical protein
MDNEHDFEAGSTGSTATAAPEQEQDARLNKHARDPQGTVYELREDGATVVTLPDNRRLVRAPVGAGRLNAQKIRQADDLVYEDIPVPEWGDNEWVRCKSLTASERGSIEARTITIDKDGNQKYNGTKLREWYCAAGLVDENGQRLFSDKEAEVALAAKNASALDRCYTKILELSKVSKKEVEEQVGNSSGGPSGDSAGGSANGTASMPTMY